MASRATQSPSRIPVPNKSNPSPGQHTTGVYIKDFVDGEENIPPAHHHPISVGHSNENGAISVDSRVQVHSPQSSQKGKGFETFLMTGDMIIRTNPTVPQKLAKEEQSLHYKAEKGSQIPRLEHGESKKLPQKIKNYKPQQQSQSTIASSKLPGPVKNHHQVHQNHNSVSLPHQNSSMSQEAMAATACEIADFPIVHAPVAEMEELSDLSQSSCSDSEMGLGNSPASCPLPSLPATHNPDSSPTPPGSANTSRLEEAMETLGKLQASLPGSNCEVLLETSFPEPLSSGDSGFVHDGHASDPDLPDRGAVNNLDRVIPLGGFLSDETLTDRDSAADSRSGGYREYPNPTMVASSSGEKFIVHGGDRPLVRTSKSHENYLQSGTGIAMVNIDIEDNLAYSLDTLTYHDSSSSSLDNLSTEATQVSRSLQNSPEKKSDKVASVEREFLPGFISLEDTKPIKLKLNKVNDLPDLYENSGKDENGEETNNSGNVCTNLVSRHMLGQESRVDKSGEGVLSHQVLDNSSGDSLQLSVLSDDAEVGNLYHQPSKAVDRPSAERLAKRLFHLEGFKKSDVSRHLCKKNDFSNLVANEYLKFFDFEDDTLDMSLRKFLSQFSLYGETQERERVLAHFSHRFMECNAESFNSEDACHTLTCAIMLLNSDLHSPNVGRRMTCQEFIENLTELNDGENFSKEVLRAIYQAIKNEPLEWAVDEVLTESDVLPQAQVLPPPSPVPQMLGSNPFLEVPDPSKTTEYKKGYVMRKCCMEPDKRRTPFGKRGWKMMYTVLRDMILYQYKDEHHLKKGQFVESSHNVIRIHHALATKAADYSKKQHVFRLQTSDWAEFLFQTGDSKELQEWVDTINLVAASLSAPALPGAVGSKIKFQRPLLPSSYTRLNLREQLHSHETRIQELEQEMHIHRTAAPEKGAKSSVIQNYVEKESYIEFELKRFKTYVYLLQGKLSAFPELEPSLVETIIGEYEEMGAGPSHLSSNQSPEALATTKQGALNKPVQRSLSDRYSYRAAIYQTDHVEYDMV